jgi:hypothetical protein
MCKHWSNTGQILVKQALVNFNAARDGAEGIPRAAGKNETRQRLVKILVKYYGQIL